MSPSNYDKLLPRVSSIVEYFYPFIWQAKLRFLDWLASYKIAFSDYMDEASSWWTFVHSQIENYILTNKEYDWEDYKWFIKSWIQFLKDFKVVVVGTEVYTKTPEYQWTIDLIGEIDGKKYILDWKTYWLAKYKFWLKIPEYKKPSDKLKKARLQLSLYARAEWIDYIWVIELTDTGYHFHILKRIPDDELEKMLEEFKFNYVDEL